MAQTNLAPIGYRFGEFLLEPNHRALTLAGQVVPLSSRALDLLLLLVEQRARVVGKDEIMASVWRGTVVEENNLAVQVSALRRALGQGADKRGFIATVPGRGYRFIGDVAEAFASPSPEKPPEEPPPPETLPLAPPPALAPAALLSPAPGRVRRRVAGWAALLLLAVCAAGLARWVWPDPAAPRMSLAVLPFRNLSGDPRRDYLADAITDDLTTDLSHLPGSTVIARESADTYKGRAVKAQIIGRALRVRYLLQGSLAGDGDMLHVNAQLIDAPTGRQLLASKFDVPRLRLDDAREQIVRRLSSVLDFGLVRIESARSLHERPKSPDAVDLLMRARSRLNADDGLAALVDAQALLEAAIATEPDYSDALALLGLVLLHKIGEYDDADEWRDHARAAAVIARANALAPRDPLAITARGTLAWEDGRCGEALPSFQLAASLDPGDIRPRIGLASCQRDLGLMAEMIDTLQKVLAVDPAAPSAAVRQNNIGLGFLTLGKPQEALTWVQRAAASIPDSAPPEPLGWREWNRLYMIAALWQSGAQDRAAAMFREYQRQCPGRTVWRLAAYDSRSMAALPGRAAFFEALRQAGMARFADEREDFRVPARTTAYAGGDFDPTPLRVPGATRIGTAELKALLGTAPPPRVLDLGHGTAAIPGAVLVWPPGVWGDPDQILDQAAGVGADRGRPIVVMADGPRGWAGYNAVLRLVAKGYRHVLWYRGGEEAWVASGGAAVDRRLQ